MNFEEVVTHINSAIKFVESETNKEFQDIVNDSYESLEFIAGHIMGMRDAMAMAQSILQKSLFGDEEE